MSSNNSHAPPPFLFSRDQKELQLTAVAFQDTPCFVIVVCPPWLATLTQDYLLSLLGEGWQLSPTGIVPPDEIPSLLVAHTPCKEREIVCFSVPKEPEQQKPAFSAFNLHREKLRAPGTRFLLWLEDRESFALFLRLAPDAYSFRSRVVVLQSEPPEPVKEEASATEKRPPDELVLFRLHIQQAEENNRPLAVVEIMAELMEWWREVGQLAEAEKVARETLRKLEQLPREDRFSEEAQSIKGRVLTSLANTVAERQGRFASLPLWKEARVVLLGLSSEKARRRLIWALACTPGPPEFLLDYPAIQQAQRILEEFSFPEREREETKASLFLHLGITLVKRGDIYNGRQHLVQAVEMASERNKRVSQAHLAGSFVLEGDFSSGATHHRRTIQEYETIGNRTAANELRLSLAELLFLLGEHQAAQRVLSEIEQGNRPPLEPATQHAILLLRADFALQEAEGEIFERCCQEAIALAEQHGLVEGVLGAWELFAAGAREQHDAGLRDEFSLETFEQKLKQAQDVALEIAGEDPPWFRILFLQLRAGHLAHHPARVQQAIVLQEEALSLCEGDSVDLAPGCGRRLGDWLVDSGEPLLALEVLDRAEAIAVERHIPREKVKIQCVRLKAEAARGDKKKRLSALAEQIEQTAQSTGSRRIKAQALLTLGEILSANLPFLLEPIPFLEKARRLFLDFPYPEKVALCQERAGDVHLLKGQSKGAERRYKQALARYKQVGLQLRRISLEQKIERKGLSLVARCASPYPPP